MGEYPQIAAKFRLVNYCNLPRQMISIWELSGWWFSTFFFSIKKWDVILPIDELQHFSEG